MELCRACQAFDIQSFAKDKSAYRGYPLQDTVHAAQDGCSFCSMLVENLQTVTEGYNLDLLEDCIRRASSPPIWPMAGEGWGSMKRWALDLLFPAWINITVDRGDASADGTETDALDVTALRAFIGASTADDPLYHSPGTLRLNVAADKDTPAFTSGDVTGQLYTQTSTWSSHLIDAIMAWHNICRTQHAECSRTFSNHQTFDVEDVPLPTRCLEVSFDPCQQSQTSYTGTGRIFGSGDDSIRFILRHTEGQRGKYITLSHRWTSDAESCSTTKDTLQCRMGECAQHGGSCATCNGKSLPISQLFKDAAMLSVNVGVKYIWIDSLCIVQDDSVDWERESAKMGQYYQSAWLTICATAISTTGGLFGSIVHDSHPRVARLPYRDKQHQLQGHFYVQYMGEGFLSGDYTRDAGKSSLLRRGWVCQELMLSRRCLTFSSVGGLFAQCQREAPHSLYQDLSKITATPTAMILQKPVINIASTSSICDSWLRVVELYSGLELSRLAKDRLVALSGLAREHGTMIERAGDLPDGRKRYISGLRWGHHRGLLWEQAAGPEEQMRFRVNGIPTWSWASMAVPVRDELGEVQSDEQDEYVLSGMQVRWSPVGHETFDACTWDERCEAIDVDEAFTPRFETRRALPLTEDSYGPAARFVILKMGGRLIPIQTHGRFQRVEDTEIAAAVTGHESDFGRHMWRVVTVSGDPDTIAGWASLEHPDFQLDGEVDPHADNTLRALAITEIPKSRGVWGMKEWSGRHTIYSVLFLRAACIPGVPDAFERVGCGRLFGSAVETMFEQVEEESLHLV
jgi:hypothetical protein